MNRSSTVSEPSRTLRRGSFVATGFVGVTTVLSGCQRIDRWGSCETSLDVRVFNKSSEALAFDLVLRLERPIPVIEHEVTRFGTYRLDPDEDVVIEEVFPRENAAYELEVAFESDRSETHEGRAACGHLYVYLEEAGITTNLEAQREG